MKTYSCLVLTLAMLVGCSTAQESQMDKQVGVMSTCDKIEALLAGHKKGFPNLKMTQTTTKYMDVWKARYHLVGDGCQVWGWSSGKFSYMCSLTEPTKQVSLEHYTQAKSIVQECLQGQWELTEGARDQGEGRKAEFRKMGDTTVLTVVAAAAPTLFKSEWKTYFFVGDPSDLN
jgi:hypothetical protein